jgi:hypothetical protein
MAVPTITSITPSSGTTAGGNPVVIKGTNFNTPAVTSVTFDGNSATFTVNSDSQITATAPPHAAGLVTVTVTNTSGSATTSYTYGSGLTLSPTQGTTAGGTTVGIYGTNLGGTTAVHFGTKLATSFTQISSTQVNAVSPAGTGTVGVTVTTPGGTSAPANYFYINPPTLTSLSPSDGPQAGGTTVTINGVNLFTTTAVTFGGVAATSFTVVSNSQITAVTPAGTGSVAVAVTTTGGVADNLSFTYDTTPTISGLTPTSGSTNGGDTVTITGTNLANTEAVTFGGTPASFGVIDDGTIAAVTPPGAAGAVDVVVTTPGGSATDPAAFTYVAPPGG